MEKNHFRCARCHTYVQMAANSIDLLNANLLFPFEDSIYVFGIWKSGLSIWDRYSYEQHATPPPPSGDLERHKLCVNACRIFVSKVRLVRSRAVMISFVLVTISNDSENIGANGTHSLSTLGGRSSFNLSWYSLIHIVSFSSSYHWNFYSVYP